MDEKGKGFESVFSEFLGRINDQLNSLYSQLNRQQEEVLPEYLTLLIMLLGITPSTNAISGPFLAFSVIEIILCISP